ncbi:MAG: PIN domain nuclease [Chitinophagales bacterium]
MNKVLVDTSVWIDALNGRKTLQTKLLNRLIDEDAPVVLCPVIIQEILQGIKEDKDFNLVKDTLSGFELLGIDPLKAAYGAASLYRSVRKHGITIRKSNDCLIAFYAISCKAALLHNDEDFNKIAQYTTLKILSGA